MDNGTILGDKIIFEESYMPNISNVVLDLKFKFRF